MDVRLYEEYDYNIKRRSYAEYLKILRFVFLAILLYYAGWANYLMSRIEDFDSSFCLDEGSLIFP